MGGIAVLLVGVVLCFFGIGSLHLAVLTSGFGLGWLIADLLSASLGTTFLLALIGAVVVWFCTTLVFRFAAFFIGIITGALIGARLARVLQPEDASWVLSLIVVVALAVACGFLADRYRTRALLWLTTIGGASMILSGLGRITDALAFLRHPDTGFQQVFATLLWVALAVAGWFVQRRLFPKKLGINETARR